MTKSIRIFLSTTLVGVVMTFTGPAYAGGNGKGGENGGAQSAAAQSGSATSPGKSGDAPGQAKKSDETSSSSSVAASTQPSAAAATGSAGAKPGQAAKSGPAKAATKPAGRGNSTNTSTSPGLKPTKSTQRNFYAPAGSSSTKRYGNGQTAGQIAIKHGAQPTTKLYGPGNSQPHKVTTCAHRLHGNGGGIDVHALKGNPSGAACAGQEPKTPARETSSGSTPESRPGRRPADPSTPKSVHVGGSSTRTKTRTVKAEANGGVLTAVRVEPAGTLPFTGLSLLGAALLALALVAAGLALRRQARA